MKKAFKSILNNNYDKNVVYSIIEHIDDDDYFYYKKMNLEDWIIMRMDIKNILGCKKSRRITKTTIEKILYILNDQKGEEYV